MTHRVRNAGFTLIELLVVIAIIIVLLGILLPAASRVRITAQEADTRALLNQIQAGVERYRLSEKQYPGPIANGLFTSGVAASAASMTMTENGVVGLCGGWEYGNTYNEQTVGLGPIQHAANADKRRRAAEAYVDPAPGTITPNKPWSNTGKSGTSDSLIPEFMDKFSDPRPILYARANYGKQGVINNADSMQYNENWFTPYKQHAKDFAWTADDTYASYETWLRHSGTTTANAIPRGKDSFILVSPGADRIFGTKDDLFNVQ